MPVSMKLFHLREGDTLVGREDAARPPDIVLHGPHIEAEHCTLHNATGHVTLIPCAENAVCCVNNMRVLASTRISQVRQQHARASLHQDLTGV